MEEIIKEITFIFTKIFKKQPIALFVNDYHYHYYISYEGISEKGQ
ncbi:hypothetical protein HMPREF0083_00864 [Aneurinibacillus aneurinilyticus ATCC 12856]|uniref:Uncharacterized protein n=1 Tax=Aneurinibacillus aneurinilyticus ATCC 12856 TaxID=649747 RepID=U1YG41_ANEAE|nr:hypothetical protein HMPREF0083_00864 [Aneurinibacillus aneurinilyticus ATCC 12856]